MGMGGDNLQVKMKLAFPLPVVNGQKFAIREGGKTIAAGVVSKLLTDDPKDKSLGFNSKSAGVKSEA